MDIHPLCAILPAMPSGDYKMLVDDIRAKGLQRPITTLDNMILDGRHRFQACNDAGISPRFEAYAGADPAGFVASSCVHRSLTQSQRALIAAGFLAYEKEQAKARQITGKHLPETCPEGSPGEARDKAGARMHVSGRTVERAARVMEQGTPELVDKVKNGEMSVNAADNIVRGIHGTLPRRLPTAKRIEQIKELASKGYRAQQIADRLQITPQLVRLLSNKNGIELPMSDAKTHALKHRRVVEQTVAGLDAQAAAIESVPYSLGEFTADETREWAESVTASIKVFTAFRNQLKDHSNAQH